MGRRLASCWDGPSGHRPGGLLQGGIERVSTRSGALAAGLPIDGVDIPVTGVGVGVATPPRVAFDGTEFLVVWQTGAARVSTQGLVLDVPSTPLVPEQIEADVTGDTGSFFAAWTEGSLIRASPVLSESGCPLIVTNPITVAVAAGYPARPRVAYGGGQYGVLWFDSSDTTVEILFARINASTGRLIDTTPLLVMQPDSENALLNAWNNQDDPAIVWDGTGFVVAWREHRSMPNVSDGSQPWAISARRIGPGSALSEVYDAATGYFPATGTGVGLAFDGAQTWLSWEQNTGAATNPVMIRRMAPGAGFVEDTFQAIAAVYQNAPKIVFDAGRQTVSVAVARASALPTVVDLDLQTGLPISQTVASTAAAGWPVMAIGSGEDLVTWIDERSNRAVAQLVIAGAGPPPLHRRCCPLLRPTPNRFRWWLRPQTGSSSPGRTTDRADPSSMVRRLTPTAVHLTRWRLLCKGPWSPRTAESSSIPRAAPISSSTSTEVSSARRSRR